MKISPASVLTALLRHHLQSRESQSKSQVQAPNIEAIIQEFEAATTHVDRLSILERILLADKTPLIGQTLETQQVEGVDGAPEIVWRVSSKATEGLNELQPEVYGRQWEAESIIKYFFESGQLASSDRSVSGVAMPFKPSASDMEKAIEALGYSSRNLFPEEVHTKHENVELKSFGANSVRVLLVITLAMTLISVVLAGHI
jgi:hypothetical protein